MTSRHGEQRRTAGGSVTLNDLTAQALTALQAAGLGFEGLELDAGFRRKPGHDHLWYVADTGVGRNGQPWLMVTAGDAKVTGDVSTPLVVYKSWETGRATIDPAEAADMQRRIEQTARRRREEDKARREAAAQQARALWSGASARINGHPYLEKKGVKAHGIRRSADRLLIPVTDAAGTLYGIQAIAPDGTKRFNTGASLGGHFHLIGTPAGRLYLCEGYATGATIHEATGPAAAAAVGGLVLVPRFRRPGPGDTDFNDLARAEGLAAVRAQLQRPERVERVATGLSVIAADRLPPEPIAWLWEGWLARGKVHLLAGREHGRRRLGADLER